MRAELKKAIKKALNENLILSQQEAESAINFVSDLLDAVIDDTEEHESFATNTIQQMKQSKDVISDLATTIFDYYEITEISEED